MWLLLLSLAKSLHVLEKKGNKCLLFIDLVWVRDTHMAEGPYIVILKLQSDNQSPGGKYVI